MATMARMMTGVDAQDAALSKAVDGHILAAKKGGDCLMNSRTKPVYRLIIPRVDTKELSRITPTKIPLTKPPTAPSRIGTTMAKTDFQPLEPRNSRKSPPGK